jgi:hypothetical protein
MQEGLMVVVMEVQVPVVVVVQQIFELAETA